LVTKEDPWFLHKACGLFVLLHFVYQLIVFGTTNAMNLRPWALIPHGLLHASSFLFKVLSKRPTAKRSSMFIWNELRVHAAIFALRAILIIRWPRQGVPIVLLTMLLADLTSHVYGTTGLTTVRGPHTQVRQRWGLKALYAAFFSMSQLGATLICTGLLAPERRVELVFLTLIPIQTSAFGMTLLRKHLISKRTWSVVYSLELVLAYIAWYRVYGECWLVLYSACLYVLRRCGVSKYLLWVGLSVACTVW